MDPVLASTLEKCAAISSTKEEYSFLKSFVTTLQENSEQLHQLDAFNHYFLKEVVQANPAPSYTLTDLSRDSSKIGFSWKVTEDMDWFLYYIFHRRYGWPDLQEEKSLLLVCSSALSQRYRRSSKLDESKLKSKLVAVLDVIILWLYHEPVSLFSLKMFISAIKLASSSPVTRRHLSIRALEWLKERFDGSDDALHHEVHELIIIIVSDVWSQIRSAGVARLGPVVEKLPLTSTQLLFEEFVMLCDPDKNTWQVIDGAISAISAIIKRFQRVGYLGDRLNFTSGTNCNGQSPRVQYQIRIGRHILDRFPGYITNQMNDLIFKLVSNPQLTIRETAIKAFVACLNRCNERESGHAFDEVYHRLRILGGLSSEDDFTTAERCIKLESIDPYSAESLLHLLFFVFKRIHDHQSYLENWEFIHETFDLYLTHPASSVRLVTSNLYKCFLARSVNYPLLVKNIVWCLIRDWKPNQNLLFSRVEDVIATAQTGYCHRPSITSVQFDDDSDGDTESWEWREGRLLVYELLCQFLLKNHYLYTFGQASRPSLDMHGFLILKNGFHSQPDTCTSHRQPRVRQTSLTSPYSVEPQDSGVENSRESVFPDSPTRGAAITRWSSLSTSDTAIHKIGDSLPLEKNNSHRTINSAKEPPRPRSPSMNTIDSDNPDPSGPLPPLDLISASQESSSCSVHKCISFFAHVKNVEEKEEEVIKKDNRLPSFRSLACQMFCTCAESLADSQWELRRMAKQTFPCLGELLRWFDPSLLTELMDTHLVSRPSLMTFACLTLLRDTLQHAAKLRCLAARPPTSWQGNTALNAVRSLLVCVDNHLPRWMRSCSFYLERKQLDCITLIALHNLLLALIHFKQDPVIHQKTLLSTLRLVDVAMKRKSDSKNDIRILGHEIFPNHSESSLSKEEFSIATASDFCAHLIEQLGDDLPLFLVRADLETIGEVTQLLVDWIGPLNRIKNKSDSEKCSKCVLQSLSTFSSRALSKLKNDKVLSDRVLITIGCIISSVAESMEDQKCLESWWMRQLVDQLIQLIKPLPGKVSGIDQLTRKLLQLAGPGHSLSSTPLNRRMSCHQLQTAVSPVGSGTSWQMRNTPLNGQSLNNNQNQVVERPNRLTGDSGVFSTFVSTASPSTSPSGIEETSSSSPHKHFKTSPSSPALLRQPSPLPPTVPSLLHRRISVCVLPTMSPRPDFSTREPVLSRQRQEQRAQIASISSALKGPGGPAAVAAETKLQLYSSLSHTESLADVNSSLEDSDEEVDTVDFPESLTLNHNYSTNHRHSQSPSTTSAAAALSESANGRVWSPMDACSPIPPSEQLSPPPSSPPVEDVIGGSCGVFGGPGSGGDLLSTGELMSDAGSDWDSDSDSEVGASQAMEGGQLATSILGQLISCRADILKSDGDNGLTKREISLIRIITSK